MRRPRPLLALALMSASVGAGCQAPPEVAYVTERFEIAPDFDYPVCQGTLERLDGHVTFVEDQLTRWIPPGERIRLYWLTEGVEGWCSEGATGCYYPGTRVVIADSHAITHEIVHAVLDAEARTNLFLEEALAELFSGVGAYHDPNDANSPAPGDLIWLSPDEYRRGDLDYEVASHFMSYLHRSHGVVPVRGLAAHVIAGASPEELELEFNDEFSASFAMLETEYVEGAPKYLRGLSENGVGIASLDGPGLDVELDCEAEHTYGPHADGGPGMFRVYVADIDVAGTYELELSGDPSLELRLIDLRRQRGWGNVVDWHNPLLVEDDRLPAVHGGQTKRLELRRGEHLLVFSSDGYEHSTASLQATFVPPPDGPTDRAP